MIAYLVLFLNVLLISNSITNAAPVCGTLTQVTGSPFAAGTTPSTASFGLLSGNLFAAVPNSAGGNVSLYSVNTNTGVFSLLTNLSLVFSPSYVAYSPEYQGSLFFAITTPTTNTVTTYKQDIFGNATPVNSVTTGNDPFSVAFSPIVNGVVLYAATTNLLSGNVTICSVATNGALSEILGSPFSSGIGSSPSKIAFSPTVNGTTVTAAVAHQGSPLISLFTLDAGTNTYTPYVGSPFSVSAATTGVAFSPDGTYLFVTSNAGSTIQVYNVSGGQFTLVTSIPGPSHVFEVTCSPCSNIIAVSGFSDNLVAVYNFDSTTGTLTEISTSPFTAGLTPLGLNFSPFINNKIYLAVANNVGDSVSVYSAQIGCPTVSITASPSTVCSGNLVVIPALVTGGLAPYTFNLYSNGSIIQTQTTSNTVVDFNDHPTASATYTVTVTDSNGCTSPISNAESVTVNTVGISLATSATSVCLGSPITLTAIGSGGSTPYTFTLFANGVQVAQNTTGIFSQSPTVTTNYTVTLVDQNNCTATSNLITVTVNDLPAAAITGPSTICLGSQATLTVTGSGGSGSYQTYTLFTNGGSPISQNNGTFTVSPTTTTIYTATVTDNNGCTSLLSNSLTVTIDNSPIISLNPMPQVLCSGATVNFTASASGSPAPTVQWQVSIDNGSTYTDIVGATTTTLSFTTDISQNGNLYRAIFTNVCGNSTTASALLTVNNSPVITLNPVQQTICSGSTATFTASASGSPTPTVQWQVSTNGGSTYTDIPGATSTTLSFTTNISQNGNLYRAVFTNSCGNSTTTSALLTVDNGPIIVINPSALTVCSGATAIFTASATGNPTPTVQWQVSTDGGTTYTDIPGATNTTLSFTADISQNGNLFRAIFTNICASAQTSAGLLVVDNTPTVTFNPLPQIVCSGTIASFQAIAIGNPSPTVQWQVSTDDGSTYTDIPGATSITLSFTTTLSQDGNLYRAVFTNSCGTVTTTSALLTVDNSPIITVNPSNQSVCAGATAIFTAAASGNPTPTVQWQVSIDGGLTYINIPGATSTTLSIPSNLSLNGNLYRAIFTNTCSTANSQAATLTVNNLPTVSLAANQAVVCTGVPVVLTAKASGGSGVFISYALFANGIQIEQNSTGIFNQSPTTATNYRVMVTDSNGCVSALSNAIVVDISPRLLVHNSTGCQGQTITVTALAHGLAPFKFIWSKPRSSSKPIIKTNGNKSSLIIVNAQLNDEGTYSVKVVDGQGCTITKTAHVTVFAQPTITLAASAKHIEKGQKVVLSSKITGTAPFKVIYSDGVVITTSDTVVKRTVMPQVMTRYSVRVIDANGCESDPAVPVTINVTQQLQVSLDAEQKRVCSGQTSTLIAKITDGQAPFTVLFSDGFKEITNARNVQHAVRPLTPTTYTVTVTDKFGVKGTASIRIELKPSFNPASNAYSKAIFNKYCKICR